MKKKYTLFANGNIYTVDKNNPEAEAVVTEKGKIVFVGKSSGAKQFLGFSNYDFYDLKGNTMLPGFIDSHLHLLLGGRNLLNIDFSTATDKNSFQEILSDYIKKNKSEWYLGGNWRKENFADGIFPDKSWIDEIIPDVPAFFTGSDLHLGLANSLALKTANISETTENPSGGIIERFAGSREPTGILKENAMKLVAEIIPKESGQLKKSIIKNAVKYLNSFGITSVHDLVFEDYFNIYAELLNEKKLSLRINYIPLLDSVSNPEDFKIDGEKFNFFLKRDSVKAFADGSLGSSTAWFFESYLNEKENLGMPTEIFSDEKYKQSFITFDNHNINILTHAIGDRAVEEVLNIYKYLIGNDSSKVRKHRIEHCQHVTKRTFDKLGKLNIIVSAQPYHLTYDVKTILKKLGRERAELSFPFNSFLKKGAKLIFGSDWPVVEPSPLKGIAAAVNREFESGDECFLKNERITVKEAIKAYTINAAYAEGNEKRKGTIEIGKLADFVILGGDIFNIPPGEIKDVKVNATITDGKIVFENY